MFIKNRPCNNLIKEKRPIIGLLTAVHKNVDYDFVKHNALLILR